MCAYASKSKRSLSLGASTVVIGLFAWETAGPVVAQETVLDPFVISATRKSESLSSLSSAVTVITKEEIENQVRVSNNDLAAALGKLVPGLAVGNQTMSTYGQTLRGRK